MSFDYKPHIMKLKGKEYLPVAARIAWLRSEHPGAQIDAELVTLDLDAQLAVFRATVVIPETGARATDYGSETAKDFGDYIEKASTKAIGRAIAALGYGTLMALELDEGERIVDSPVAAKNGGGAAASVAAPAAAVAAQPSAEAPTRAASRSGGTTVSAPASTHKQAPAAAARDADGARERTVLTQLLAGDPEALGKLPKPLDEMTAEERRRTRLWLYKRGISPAAQYGLRIAQAASEQEVDGIVAEALSARDKRVVTMELYDALLWEGEARITELSGPLLAGAAAQVAS